MKRSRIRPISKKRASDLSKRAMVVVEVLARDPQCRAHGLELVWPSGKRTVCAGRSTEVHELWRGKMRGDCWLDPEKCIGLCSPCHSFVTLNPAEAVRLGHPTPQARTSEGMSHHQWIDANPAAAHVVGLHKFSWERTAS
jgi:hypothetical protein